VAVRNYEVYRETMEHSGNLRSSVWILREVKYKGIDKLRTCLGGITPCWSDPILLGRSSKDPSTSVSVSALIRPLWALL
jgi:hypothetical protein